MIAQTPFQAIAQSPHANGQFGCAESFFIDAQITAQVADANYFDYAVKCQETMQNGSQKSTT